MIWVDWVFVAIIGLSALISVLRGFVKEALSLAGWIAAFFLAKMFYETAAEFLTSYIDTNSIRLAIAWVSIFVVTLIVAGMINYLAGRFIEKTGLSGTDRLLGMFFGALRGILISALLVLAAREFTPMPKDDWWAQSEMIPHFDKIADWFYQEFGDKLPEVSLQAEELVKSQLDENK